MSGHTSSVNAVLQINSNQVATASADSTIKIWNIGNTSLVNTYSGHSSSAQALAILPGGLLASGSNDLTIRVWNMQSQDVTTVSGLPAGVNAMILNPTVSPNGALVVVMASGYLSFYDAVTLSLLYSINASGHAYYTVDILLPSGNAIVGGSYLDIYNTTGGLVYSNVSNSSSVNRVKLLPDNVTVACGLQNGAITLFNSSGKTFGATYTIHSSYVTALFVTPDRLNLISGSMVDNKLVLWSWASMSLTQVKTFSVNGLVFSGTALTTAFTSSKELFLFLLIKLKNILTWIHYITFFSLTFEPFINFKFER
jgi:WD40 repeat protein